MRIILRKYLQAFYYLLDAIISLVYFIVLFVFAPLLITDKFQTKGAPLGILELAWKFTTKASKIFMEGKEE